MKQQPPGPLLQPLATAVLFPVSVDVTPLSPLREWNHAVLVLL